MTTDFSSYYSGSSSDSGWGDFGGNNTSNNYFSNTWLTQQPSTDNTWLGMDYSWLTNNNNTGLWDWIGKNETLLGAAMQGAAAWSAYDNNEANRDLSKEQFAQELALKEQGLALQAQQIAVMEATLADKIKTRRRHNETINAGPGSPPKEIKMG